MTPNEFEIEMAKIYTAYGEDEERFHEYADRLMCSVLKKMGYTQGIEIFENANKWYA